MRAFPPAAGASRSPSGAKKNWRYSWEHDLTLFCQDATHYEPGIPRTLGRIRSPASITFDNKVDILQKVAKEDNLPLLSDEDVVKWQFRTQRQFLRYCMEPAPTPASEALFIACSWETVAGQASPNRYAQEQSRFLEEDVGRKRSKPLISVFIMEGVPGEFFTQQLYARLDQSSLGLILLTADIPGQDGKVYSKPNVYHELGYLMKQLGGKRLAILCEKNVVIPTNIHDVIYIPFDLNKLILVYSKVIEWISHSTSLSGSVRRQIGRNYSKHLNDYAEKDIITSAEKLRAMNRMQQVLHSGD